MLRSRLLLAWIAALLAAAPAFAQGPVEDVLAERFGLPAEGLVFVENRGQWPSEVRYLAQLSGANVWVTTGGLVYDLYRVTRPPEQPGAPQEASAAREQADLRRQGHVVRVRFGSGGPRRAEGRERRAGFFNYLLGARPERWATRVPGYAEVVLSGVGEGVALRLRERDGVLDYALEAAPGADPGAVRVMMEGAEGLQRPLPPRPARRGGGDGDLVFGTYLGGAAFDTASALAVGSDRSAFVGGRTESADFPATTGAYDTTANGDSDAFVAHLSADGAEVLFATYLGGANDELLDDLTLDGAGDIFVAGRTESADFPATTGAYDTTANGDSDAFVAHLSADGAELRYGTYLGGDGFDDANALTLGDGGDVFLTGQTRSDDFPTTAGVVGGAFGGVSDAFVVRLDPEGDGEDDLLWGTYLGGADAEFALALAVAEDESVYLTGRTASADFPTTDDAFDTAANGGDDAFLVHLSADGDSVRYGTYLGGDGFDIGHAVVVAADTVVYLTGRTASADFPTTDDAFDTAANGGIDAYVVTLDPTADGEGGLRYGTYLGGTDDDLGFAMARADDGELYVAGRTLSADFPTTDDAFDTAANGGDDAFVVRFDAEAPGSDGLRYGTYLGGADFDGVSTVAAGTGDDVYVTGRTSSADFPTSSGASSSSLGGDSDAHVTRLSTAPTNEPPTVESPIADTSLVVGGEPFVVDLDTVFADPDDDELSFAVDADPDDVVALDLDGSVLTVTADAAGAATVTVTATDPDGESADDAFEVVVTEGNEAPVVERPIADTSLVLGEGPLVVDLDTVFADPDDDELSFAVDADPGDVVALDLDGSVLTVTADAAGAATVTVTASDPDGESADDAFEVAVTEGNQAPTVESPIADTSLVVGGEPFVVDLDTVFADPDDDELSFAIDADPDDVVALDLDGSVLTVTADAAGAATVTVTATDPDGESAADAFVVTVSEPKDEPPIVTTPIEDATLALDGGSLVVDLTEVFEDPEGQSLSFEASADPDGVVTLDLDGSTLTVTPESAGATTVTVTASDPAGNEAADAFVVTVTEANPPPTVESPIPDQVLLLGGNVFTVDLDTVFADPGDALTFAVDADPDGIVMTELSGSTLTVTAEAAGTTVVTVTATDSEGQDASDAFSVVVEEDDDPPTVENPIPDQSLALGDAPLVVDLNDVFEDPEGKALSFAVEMDPAGVVTASLEGSVLTVTPKAAGSTVVTVTATDPGGGAADEEFTVTVGDGGGDLPPRVVAPIADQTLVVDGSSFVVNLAEVFEDPEGKALSFAASADPDGVVALDVTGSVLTLAPEAVGSTVVTVTAADPAGNAAADAFIAVVAEDNRPPTVERPLADRSLAVGGTFSIALDTVFADPEDEPLTFAVEAAPGGVVEADLDGDVLTVTAEGPGSAVVTATATDPADQSASEAFTVTVMDQPPRVVAPIGDATLTVGGEPLVVDLTGVFNDPEGETLTFSASAAPAGTVAVDVDGSLLTVTAEAPGQATVSVTATDPAGNPAADAFVVTVADQAPVVVDPVGDAALVLGGGPLTVDLGAAFEDPEGAALSFAADADPAGVADAEVDGSTLTVTPEALGQTTVTVTATDPAGNPAADAFVVTVTEPSVSVGAPSATPNPAEAGTPVAVRVAVSGVVGGGVRLFYRRGGEDSFDSVPMAASDGEYVGTIPGPAVTSRGVVYYVEAENPSGASSRSAEASLQVQVASGLVASVSLPRATTAGGYRLISVPLSLDAAAAGTVLDAFGPYAEDAWRFFSILPPGEPGAVQAASTPDQFYREGPSTQMRVGLGFWLIVRDGGTFATGAGRSVTLRRPFIVDLHEGWNLVGTPFDFPVTIEQVRLASGAPVQLNAYGGTWQPLDDAMQPFVGYALRVDEPDELLVSPTPEEAARPVGDGEAEAPAEPAWAIGITATAGEARDEHTVAAVAEGAREGRDALDWFEPPVIGEYLSVAFDAADGVPLAVDARPASDEGTAWDLRVRTASPERVTLAFDGLDAVPAGFVVWLVDEAAGSVRDLRERADHRLASPGGGTPARLQLIAGTEAFARSRSAAGGAVPEAFALQQNYPNPFAALTTIRYALPEPAAVRLEVFDALGRRVAVLVDAEREAGHHEVVWDAARDATGLASGTYFYRLRAGDFTDVKRLVVVR